MIKIFRNTTHLTPLTSHLKVILSLLFIALCGTSVAQEKKYYNEEIDAMAQIEAATQLARQSDRYVLCQVGGNWCPWCLRFADYITNDSTINAVIEQNFVYIHVNYHPRKAGEVGKALMKRLNNAGRFGFPVLVVLDEQGNILHMQDSGYLEEGKSYNKEKVLRFFQNWTPKAVRD